jgi:hypothetical protein
VTHTHTYAVLNVSVATYSEILGRLQAAQYGGQIDEERHIIDMHGLAIAPIGAVSQPDYYGRAGYDAYSKAKGGVAVNGDVLPPFDDCPADVRAAWNAAAEAIRRA